MGDYFLDILYLRCLWTVYPWNLLRVDVFWMSTAKTDKASLRNSCTGLNILPGRAVKLQQFNQCDYAGQDRDMRKRDQHTHSRKSVHHQGKQEVGHRFGFFPRPDICLGQISHIWAGRMQNICPDTGYLADFSGARLLCEFVTPSQTHWLDDRTHCVPITP